ncbi:MAG: acyltransferase, partial [Planctomycetota bacterium]
LHRVGGLKHYFVGWGLVVALSYVLCPSLDSMAATQSERWWFAAASGLRQCFVLDFAPLFAIGFLLYQFKTRVGSRWQNVIAMLVSAWVFHQIDHGKHNPAATALIVGVVAMAAYGKIPVLRWQPIMLISTISYPLYLCHNNIGCVLMHTFDGVGVPPWLCLVIAIAFSLSMAILITRRVEQPMTKWLRSRLIDQSTKPSDRTGVVIANRVMA